MDSTSFIEILEYERTKFNTTVQKIYDSDPKAQITRDMDIKEILGHISWYEDKIVSWIKNRGFQPDEFDNLSVDAKNKQIASSYEQMSYTEVKEKAEHIFKELVTLLQNVTPEQLDDRTILKNDGDPRLPWQVLMENTFIHYEEHFSSLNRWIKKTQET